MKTSGPAVETQAITKNFGSTVAVDGVSLTVSAGEVYALLGPNGAGKTTLVGMLTTLVRPTAGTARVAGFDVVREPHHARRSVGVVLQESALDRYLPLEENLYYLARVYHLPRADRLQRVDAVLAFMRLESFRRTPVGKLSGGTIRRAEIAAGILHEPMVLLLDEPTVGLDIEARQNIWLHVRELGARGTAVILTTHYLEEADRLADRVGILNHGRLVAEGTPLGLKASLTRRRLSLYPDPPHSPAVQSFLSHWVPRAAVTVEQDPVVVIHMELTDEKVERAVLADLAARTDLVLRRLEVGPGTLDRVFLEAVGTGFRPREGVTDVSR